MSWKQTTYYSGQARPGAPGPPPDELSPQRRLLIRRVAQVVGILGVGVAVGMWFAPEAPRELQARLAACDLALQGAGQARTAMQKQMHESQQGPAGRGQLRRADRQRHEANGRRYMATLRGVQAQGAAELMGWFIGRWNELLDSPQPDDRVGRRAATLSLLVGGMAANVDPGDYVPWQAEFLSNKWLSELHFDSDGDGLPAARTAKNTHDGFANVSVCHIAMALNQSVLDAQVLMMPEMRCDRPEARMSVFLQGATFNDALTEFARALREQGFIVVERQEHGLRLILVGIALKRPVD